LQKASFHGVIGPFDQHHHYRVLFAFQTHRIVGPRFPSLTTTLRGRS
jgi:hypothetical protein